MRTIRHVRHILDRDDLGDDALVAVTTSHFVAGLQAALDRQVHLDHLLDARREFIAAGKLLVRGTAQEVISSQKLNTWAIHGEHLGEFAHRLDHQPGVDQTVVFGASLHVTGNDGPQLEQTVKAAAAQAGLRAEPVETGIEDVFIYLMNKDEATRSADRS